MAVDLTFRLGCKIYLNDNLLEQAETLERGRPFRRQGYRQSHSHIEMRERRLL